MEVLVNVEYFFHVKRVFLMWLRILVKLFIWPAVLQKLFLKNKMKLKISTQSFFPFFDDGNTTTMIKFSF